MYVVSIPLCQYLIIFPFQIMSEQPAPKKIRETHQTTLSSFVSQSSYIETDVLQTTLSTVSVDTALHAEVSLQDESESCFELNSLETEEVKEQHVPVLQTVLDNQHDSPDALVFQSKPVAAVPFMALNDIGLAVGQQLNREDRIRFLQPWRPLSADEFPSSTRQSDSVSKTGVERRRKLLPKHLDTYPWLAVSRCPGIEGAFCVPCVLFAAGSRSVKSQPLGKLVTKPLANFEDLTGKNGVLTRHQNAIYHQQNVTAMDDFKRITVERTQLDIHSRLDEQHRRDVERNRNLLKPIVDTILTCARQNIALRAHRGEMGPVNSDGAEPLENDGNFRALLRLRIRAGDKVLQDHARNTKGNSTYHSPQIQNELISAAGDIVKEEVLRRVKKAKFWAMVADETTDRHNREQLVVVIRYVLNDSGTAWHCYEDPVAIMDIYANIATAQDEGNEIRLSGIAIGDALLRVACELGLNLTWCVGQGYDGASTLSSQRVGAAQRFMERAESAHYFHCAMHCLNLSAMKAISIPAVRHAEDVVSDTVSCFRSSAKRSALLKSRIEKCDDTRISKTQLAKLCSTRFIERHTSVICFRSLLRFVNESLNEMTTWQSTDARKTANTLINSISQSETIVGLVVLENISSIMLPTTRMLQTSGLDLVEAMTLVNDMIASLSALRSSERFALLFQDAKTVGVMLGITLIKPRTPSRSVYRAAASIACNDSVEDYYRINVFFPALDEIMQDLQLRFGPKQQLAANFSRAIPSFMHFDDQDSDWNKLEAALDTYIQLFSDPLMAIKAEYDMWRRKWQQQAAEHRPKSALAALDHCSMYPNMCILLQLLATLPVTTTEAERMFSKMERTMTAIRASMQEDRLEALLLLQVHRDLTPSPEAVIDRFAATSARRLQFAL